jgi:hypothetical protein
VPVLPHDQLAIKHYVEAKLTDRVDDLREIPAQRALLARLQYDAAPVAERYAAETVELRLERPAIGPVQRKPDQP